MPLGELVQEVYQICESLETVDMSFVDKLKSNKKESEKKQSPPTSKLPPKPFKLDDEIVKK
jgi:hypothetical protein